MAAEGAIGGAESVFLRRMKERVYVWRRLFMQNWNLFKASRIGVVGLAIMIAFVILALAAPFMGLRDPIRWTAPDEDLIEVEFSWTADSSIPGSEWRLAPPVTQGVAFRIFPRNFDARADRVYVAAENRLYALHTQPEFGGANAWQLTVGPKYFDAGSNISVPPVAMNYGEYQRAVIPDFEVYLGTEDGGVHILRDQGAPPWAEGTGEVVPSSTRIQLDGKVTGLAAFNPDMAAPPRILGTVNHVWFNVSRDDWDVEVVRGINDIGEFASLALNSTNEVYVASYDVLTGRPSVLIRNNNAWTGMPPSEPFSGFVNVGLYTSLAIGSDGHPRMAYYEETERQLKYAEWDGFNWSVEYVDYNINVDAGRSASLALDGGDNPHIAYYNATGGKLQYATRVGTNWNVFAPDSSTNTTGSFASLALDPTTDEPRIAYYDSTGRILKYAEANGPVWTPEVVDLGGGDDVGQYASLVLDASGRPHIAYYNATGEKLQYATRTAVWTLEDVDAGPHDLGKFAAIAVNATGVPAVSYHDATDFDLKFASRDAGVWNPQTLQRDGFVDEYRSGIVGQYTSLKFDGDDQPHIAHYSFASGRSGTEVVVAGTTTGKLYVIEVGIPGQIVRAPREKQVGSWEHRVRWVADLGSEVHIAPSPLEGTSAIPLFSPSFNENGTAVFVGTADGRLIANRTLDGSPLWDSGAEPFIRIAKKDGLGLWSSPPVVQKAEDGPEAQTDVVYAASDEEDYNDDGRLESLIFALNVTTGDPIREWAAFGEFVDFNGAAPIYRTGTAPEGGNLAQPTVEGGTIYVGSTSGHFYALRRDGVGDPAAGGLPPASIKWSYSDLTLLGLDPEFTSPPIVFSSKSVVLVAANQNNGTPADRTDDRGVLYSMTIEGKISWKKTYVSVIPGKPSFWFAPRDLDSVVWVGYGGKYLTGVQALRAKGSFLAPSPPSWAHTYKCPTVEQPGRTCSGYPSGNQYWLGLDSQGRDVFSQVIWGSRIALLVGFLSAFFTVVLGVVVGLIAGYVGGKVEAVLMRFTDVILVLPGLPLIITLAAVLGASIWNIILVIALLGWPGIARIIRAEVLSLKERPFIDSARVTGASTTRIVFRHIAPNVMPLAFLYMTFAVSGAILTEAALSFIGLGDINTMSWGIMLQLVSQSKALTAWWWLLPPGLAITLISLAFFLVGRAFDEIVNPRLRKR